MRYTNKENFSVYNKPKYKPHYGWVSSSISTRTRRALFIQNQAQEQVVERCAILTISSQKH